MSIPQNAFILVSVKTDYSYQTLLAILSTIIIVVSLGLQKEMIPSERGGWAKSYIHDERGSKMGLQTPIQESSTIYRLTLVYYYCTLLLSLPTYQRSKIQQVHPPFINSILLSRTPYVSSIGTILTDKIRVTSTPSHPPIQLNSELTEYATYHFKSIFACFFSTKEQTQIPRLSSHLFGCYKR